jgi:hypothetical protein
MARCETCDGKAKMFSNECESCASRRLRAEEDRLRAQRQQRETKRREEIDSYFRETTEALIGGSMHSRYLYKTAYVQVDSLLLNEQLPLSFESVFYEGLNGWKIESVIPRTFGMSLENKDGYGNVSFAGGIGGHVVGAHVLMSFELTTDNIEQNLDRFRTHLEENWTWE